MAMDKKTAEDLFREYIDAYNTATLPSLKYYDVQRYEHAKFRKRLRKQGIDPDEAAALAEELERQKQADRHPVTESERIQADFKELTKIDDQKRRELLELETLEQQKRLAYKSGNTRELTRINARLAALDRESR